MVITFITGGGPLPNILQEANVDVYTQQQCSNMWSSVPIGDYHICVGDHGNAGGCNVSRLF